MYFLSYVPTLIALVPLCLGGVIPEADHNALAKRATPPSQTDATFINTVLTRVNADRAAHNARPLTWDAGLASYARTYASKCNGQHSNGPYGENTYMFWTSDTSPNFVTWTNTGIDWWYAEGRTYSPSNPAPSYHFTQLVWKSTTKIGCAWSATQCNDAHKSYQLYCEFSPMGNIAGQFAANVS